MVTQSEGWLRAWNGPSAGSTLRTSDTQDLGFSFVSALTMGKAEAVAISGGTFTLTNVGSYGTTMTFPVINQPQIAILSTDGVKKRPVVVESADGSDAIVIHPVGHLALAWDHRAVDGAYAAAFLKKVKDILETRDWGQELS